MTFLLRSHRRLISTRVPTLLFCAIGAAGGCSGEPESDSPVQSYATAAGSWTNYGYDLANTQVVAGETALGVDNVHELAERWRLRVPGGATSTPVIYAGTAYFGSWAGDLYAVDADSGEIRWQRGVTSMLARSTPLVTEDRVFIAAGRSLIALERASGAVVYERELDAHPLAITDSSPKLVDGLLIIGVASAENALLQDDYTFIGSVVALDATSGDEIWRVPTTGQGPGPCVGGAGTGVWSSAAIDRQLGLAFVGTGQSSEEPTSSCSDSLLAIHYARNYPGNRLAWKQQYTAQDVYLTAAPFLGGVDSDIGASPNLFEVDGTPLVGVGDKGGSYRVFDRRSGAQVWRKNLDIGLYGQAGGVMTTAAVHDRTIYVASNVTNVGTFAITGDHDPQDVGVLYALDAANGGVRWQRPLPSGMFGSFAVANGVLYHPIIDGTFYARDLATGDVLWSTKLANNAGAGPSVVDGNVYVSAGMVLNGANTIGGGSIARFAPGTSSVAVRDAPSTPLAPLDQAQCKAATTAQLSDDCAECMCECNSTASGHCDVCFNLSGCSVLFCSFAAPGADMRACMEQWCSSKLLPTFLFDRAVEIAPCSARCAGVCPWFGG